MNRKNLFMVAALVSLVFATASSAQFWGNTYTGATYNMSLPMSETKDFADAYSWRGMGLEFRKFTKPNMSAGISVGWNVFHKEVNGTISIADGRGSATGNQDRTINIFPLMAGFQVYGGQEGGTRPYLGLYGPGYYVAQRLDIGVYSFQQDGWNWGLAPELGVLVPLQGRDTNFLLSVRYNYAFEGYGRGPYSYLGFNVGFAWSSY